MNDLPRWTVEELAVRYQLEPLLRDVFVEGTFDKDVLSRCFRELKHPDRIAYEINSVDIPSALLGHHGLTNGNKQRVIALARELASLSADSAYRCLVDRDLDHWFGKLEVTPRLVWTGHCSIELYFFSEEILRDILLTAAKIREPKWDELLQSFTQALRTLYALRLADRELGWGLEWLPVERCLSAKDGRVVLDIPEYVKRLLMKNRKISSRAEFEEARITWETQLTGDPRSHIHGHDFVKVLVWIVREFRGLKEFASESAIERLLVLLSTRTSGLMDLLP